MDENSRLAKAEASRALWRRRAFKMLVRARNLRTELREADSIISGYSVNLARLAELERERIAGS